MTELETISSRVDALRRRIDQACLRCGRDKSEVLLCAASKTQSPQTVALAAGLPIDIFGENRVQELVEKNAAGAYGTTPLHFIGHLQTNKVKQVVGAASLIHSIDSEKLLRAVEKEAAKLDLVQNILLEVNIGGEESKSGAALCDLKALCQLCDSLEHVRIQGLMCVPPRTGDEAAQRKAFEALRRASEQLADEHFAHTQMQHLSMGMSGDFEAAIAEGATIVRLGTAIFGPRNYSGV